jgi:hypothetical protein
VFLTKKFKEKNSVMVLKRFINAMIRNIKTHNIFDIIGFSKSMELNKCMHKLFFYENIHLNVSYDFSKFDGFRKIKV